MVFFLLLGYVTGGENNRRGLGPQAYTFLRADRIPEPRKQATLNIFKVSFDDFV
jgi:hypothetical protein